MLQFIIALIVVGAILYFVQRASFIDDTLKLIIKIVLIVIIVIWALKLVWPMTGLG
jgi:type III secretory pathway component EscS